MNKTRFLFLYFLLSGIFGRAQTSYVKGIVVENIQDLQIGMQELVLDETTVTVQRVVMEFYRQIIYLGKFEKENVMDGVELVNKIWLHGIVVDMATNSIKTLRCGAVQLRINGSPTTLNDVRGIEYMVVNL